MDFLFADGFTRVYKGINLPYIKLIRENQQNYECDLMKLSFKTSIYVFILLNLLFGSSLTSRQVSSDASEEMSLSNQLDLNGLELQAGGTILLAIAETSTNVATMTTALVALGYTVDYWDLRISSPTLTDLIGYGTVMTWSNGSPIDPVSWGDGLADYLDQGGNVILSSFGFFEADLNPEGRFLSGAYSPFSNSNVVSGSRTYSGTSTHTIVNGVLSYSTVHSAPLTLSAGAELVASYDDGVPFVALLGSVIGINSYLSNNFGGDMNILVDNAIQFLNGGPVDTTPPTIDNPVDVFYSQYTYGHEIIWTATDENPDVYSVTRDGGTINTGVWSSGTSISVNIDQWGLGIYTVVITVFDVAGNSASDTVTVSVVVDITSPTVSSPADISYVEGSTGNSVSWTATDNNPFYYDLYIDGAYQYSYVWYSGVVVSINVDGFSVGDHLVYLIFYDSYDNSATDSVTITVTTLYVAPTVTTPDFISYPEGATGNTITWTATGSDPLVYNLYIDGGYPIIGYWVSGVPVTVNVDGLAVGDHTIEIYFWDTQNAYAYSLVMVIVSETTAPSLTSPVDISYAEGTTGNSISWVASDPSPGTYTIEVDGDTEASGSWISGAEISFNVDNLMLGIHTIVIFVSDNLGNTASDSVIVTVTTDYIAPTVTTPADISYTEGSAGNSITWTATSSHAYFFEAYVDVYEILAEGLWVSEVPLTVNVDGLSLGIHTVEVYFWDDFGNFAYDSVIVTVFADEVTTSEPITSEPITSEPITSEPITSEPITSEPTTSEPTTSEPTTSEPTTSEPTTSEPTTSEPTTPDDNTGDETTPPNPLPLGNVFIWLVSLIGLSVVIRKRKYVKS